VNGYVVEASTAQAPLPPPQVAEARDDDTPTASGPTPSFAHAAEPALDRPSPAPLVSPRTTPSSDEVTLTLGDRQWRIRGLAKDAGLEALKVKLLVSREGAGFHVDTLELYAARQRQQYATLAAQELCVDEQVIKRDLGMVLLRLEELQEHAAKKTADDKSPRPKLSDEERHAALALLRDPRLVERILDDFDRLGVVGERTNKPVAYLAATSRLRDEPSGARGARSVQAEGAAHRGSHEGLLRAGRGDRDPGFVHGLLESRRNRDARATAALACNHL
jgi:hypothetical protein